MTAPALVGPTSLSPRTPRPPRQLTTRFDAERGTLWMQMRLRPRPCFNPEFLAEFGAYVTRLAASGGVVWHHGVSHAVEYTVAMSRTPGVFSYGGDLSHFRACIVAGDRDALLRYARRCVDIQAPWSHRLGLPATTVALVQGEALGGGMEWALTNQVIVAEESARMGLPESRFGLFPGMGAFSFLSRKVGRRVAERMITSGAIYSARELHELGVVDVLAPDGGGEQAVRQWIERRRRGDGAGALARVWDAVEPPPYAELYRIAELWVDAALALGARDLALMERLVRAQDRGAARQLTIG